MVKNLLVTGAAGFIGLNWLEYFIKQKHNYEKIVSIDKMGYATEYNKESYFNVCSIGNIEHREINLATITEMPSGGLSIVGYKNDEKWDILDFASESHVDNSIKNPNAIYNENVKIPGGVINLVGLENINRYIHISTDEVYGELDYETPKELWFKPITLLNPNNPYSASKASQDCYLLAMKHTFGLPVKFIRLANQFGPHQHKEKMLPATVLRVLNGESIKIYGEGLNIRQWTPVVDSVKILYDALVGELDDEFVNDVLHISKLEGEKGDVLYTNNEVVEMWEEIMKEIISEKGWRLAISKKFIEDRKGHDKVYALESRYNVNKYFTETLKDRFEETIRWYVENEELFGDKK